MRIAIIDLGTNSVRFDVHSLLPGRKSKLLHREKLMIRLGQGVFLKGRIEEASLLRATQAFVRFQRVALGLRVRKILAFGTSALREAQNSQILIDAVREKTGIEIVVLSGKDEAKLIARGVLPNESSPRGRFCLLDIGGGSTEVSLCQGKKILKAESFPLGTARIQQVFLKSVPPRPQAVKNLRSYIRQVKRERASGWPKASYMIGSSGTVRALAKILGKKEFSLSQLSELVEEMARMDLGQLMEVEGMEPKRVDMILAGAILLEEMCSELGVSRIRPTEYSLRDGLFEEQRELAVSHETSLEFHQEDIFARAVKFGEEETHVRALAALAESLFLKLRPLHKLEIRWQAYLVAAVVLRNCGEAIAIKKKEDHSYYIVKNSDFPGLEAWEHEFIALLCKHYGGTKIRPKGISALGRDEQRKRAFPKLLALLRLLDALDPGPSARMRISRVQITKDKAAIFFGGKGVEGVEHLLTERKRKLFEEAFGRQLFLKRSR